MAKKYKLENFFTNEEGKEQLFKVNIDLNQQLEFKFEQLEFEEDPTKEERVELKEKSNELAKNIDNKEIDP
jgi:hypothetical protein